VWLQQSEDDVIPERFEFFWHQLKRLHPTWRFVTWTDEADLFAFMRCREVYDRQTTHAGRSDVARYEIVAQHGGIYLDTDVEPLRAFDELLIDDRPFAAWEDNRILCPTVIGAPPHHAALTDLLDRLPRWAAVHAKEPPNRQTGPHFFTANWATRQDVRLLDRSAFYPVGWWERRKLGGPYPAQSYAVHHWEQSWDPGAKAKIDARQG
jgi:mannosyltransferase OCH1-like enzyme